MNPPLLSRFGELAAAQQHSRLPESLRLKAKAHLLDVLGLLHLARRHRHLDAARRFLSGDGGDPAQVSGIALLGGIGCDARGLDDFDEPTRIHPGSVVVPALLAASGQGISGERFLDGLVAGYEAACRLGELCRSDGMHRRGFHPSAVLGALAAAAGVARLQEMDAEGIAGCMGLAASQASGLFELDPASEVKGLQVGLASRNGVMAVQLYRAGYRPAASVLEGPQGLRRAFGAETGEDPGGDPTDCLSPASRLERVSFKPYTHFTDLHPLTALLLELLGRHSLRPESVERVRIRLPAASRPGLSHHYPPASPRLARRCPRFLVGSLIGRPPREALDPLFSHFAKEALEDPRLLELGGKVDWGADLEGADGAEVEIHLCGGEVLEATGSGYPGDGRRPDTRWSLSQVAARAGKLHFSEAPDPARWPSRVAGWEEIDELGPLVREIAGWLYGGA